MKITKLFILGLVGSFLMNSCTTDDDDMPDVVAEDDYSDGILILNEGSQSAGTVSFLEADYSSIENNIFESVNVDMDLGLFVQSIFFDEENAYIISNGSNLITVVDRYTFEFKGAVDSGLNVPLFGAVSNGKAFVSNVADFASAEDDFIAVIDLVNLEVEETVVAGTYLSEVMVDNGLVYVEGAAYGAGNSIEVFDPASLTFTKSIPTNNALNSFAIEGSSLFALSSTKLERIDLNTDTVISEIEFSENFPGVNNLDIENGMIYFTSGTSVYELNQDFEEEPTEALLSYESTSQYGQMYAFNVEDQYIYISDAGDFASNGTVRVYTISGGLVDEFEAGIAPNGFYFND
ncbi:YncE family protein [Christiangramia forsetii]|uniref:Quinoprotein amine dehydrogenase n=2 Tax=Christiangramia forsetii TaxID=411153 RepID=A0M0B5_CHRFK|nr:DUF5074 domain-containing protein [Christiangramia forsetii]GGG41352.1 hypothetical protein GCM10011532_26330 [Christiangramia forsetii]CAL66060.1 conserved hypothetical protein, secreted [Christiangramia forsetii KT0803]